MSATYGTMAYILEALIAANARVAWLQAIAEHLTALDAVVHQRN